MERSLDLEYILELGKAELLSRIVVHPQIHVIGHIRMV